MANNEQYVATLQWAIDRQKSDYIDIRKQLRRYLVVVVTVVVARVAVFLRGDGRLFDALRSESLAQDGLLWQTNILPAKMAPVFTDTFSFLAGIFSTFGLLLVIFCMLAIIRLEQAQDCHPIGDAKNIIGKDIAQLERWIEKNDELIHTADQGRKNIIRIGTDGIILIIVSFVTQILSSSLAVGGFLLLVYLYQKLWFTLRKDRVLSDTRVEKFMISVLIVMTMVQPVSSYQDVYGYFPVEYTSVWFVVTLLVVAYYLRSDIVSFKNTVGDM